MVRLTNRKKSRYLGQRVQEDLLDFSSLKGLIRVIIVLINILLKPYKMELGEDNSEDKTQEG